MVLLFFSLGTIVGSFLGVVADRLPQGKSLLSPRSHCNVCQQQLHVFNLIPLVSIVKQRFCCSYCQTRLPVTLFLVELCTGLLFGYYLSLPLIGNRIWQLFWLLTTLVLALIDAKYLIVEGRIFLPTGFVLMGSALFLGLPFYWYQPLFVFLGYFFLERIQPQSLGIGDVWLFSLWSLFLPVQNLLLVLIVASASGILFWLCLTKRKKTAPLPFVPFLFVGLLVVLLFNPPSFGQ